jgi:hypothetical protein
MAKLCIRVRSRRNLAAPHILASMLSNSSVSDHYLVGYRCRAKVLPKSDNQGRQEVPP